MAATIGALRVVLGADTAAFSKGLKSAESDMAKWGRRVGTGAVAAAAALTTATVAVGVAVRNTLTEFDNLAKTSQKIGVPVEDLTRLQHAAELSGLGFDTMRTALAKLSKNMIDAEQGLLTPTRAFETLGVSIRNTEGNIKTISELLPEMAERFSTMKDGPEKVALAMQILGRSGSEMIPLLNAGSAGLKEMMAEAESLGLVLSTKAAKDAERFNDALEVLGKVWKGFTFQVTAAVAGPLADLAEALRTSAREGGGLVSTGQAIGQMLAEAIGWFASATTTIRAYAEAMRGAWTATSQATSFDFSAANATLDATRERIAAIREEGRNFQFDLSTAQISREFTDMFGVVQEGTPVIENFTEKTKEAAAAQKAANDLVAEGAAVFASTRTASEAYSAELTRLQTLYAAGAINADTYARAQSRAAEDAGATWRQAGSDIAGSFSDIAGAYGTENSKMAAAAKAFGAVQATISAFTGAAKALELPFPANLAAMAAVLAQGLSFVASIKSQKVPRFAEGGSFRVGGAGAIDSKTVSFKASPGEMVDIRKPGNDNGAGANNVEVNVYAPPGTGVRRETKQVGSKRVEDIIIDEVDRGIANGQFDRSLGGRYGLGRRTIQR